MKRMITKLADFNMIAAPSIWAGQKLSLINLECFLNGLEIVKEIFLTLSAIVATVWGVYRIIEVINKRKERKQDAKKKK